MPHSSEALATVVKRISRGQPSLAELPPDQLDLLAHAVVTTNLMEALRRLADLEGIDWAAEKALFLRTVSPTGSAATVRTYQDGLRRLEAWCQIQGLNPVGLGPAQADDYLYSLRSESRAAASVRLDAAGASSFYSFLGRRHASVINPFRGSRARPKVSWGVPVVPSPADLGVLLVHANPLQSAVLTVLAGRGLRIGALPTLKVRGNRFWGTSKGRSIRGSWGPVIPVVLEAAGLDPVRPFARWTDKQLGHLVRGHSRRLFDRGLVGSVYSAHDFRHYFAVAEYRRDPNVFRLEKLLGHTSVATTETYLRSLDVLD